MSEAYFESMGRAIKRMKTTPLNWLAMSAEERKALVAIKIFNWKPSAFPFPDWPTSIAAAFEVVEKMREKEFICVIKNRTESNLWDCTFQQYCKMFSADGTLPEAIALAALRAHGVEVDL